MPGKDGWRLRTLFADHAVGGKGVAAGQGDFVLARAGGGPGMPAPEQHSFSGVFSGIGFLKISHIGLQGFVETKFEMRVLGVQDP
jgi:hypothetical protein